MFARAHAELAQTYAVLPLYAPTAGERVHDRALVAAQRALALDSSLAPAWSALGYLHNVAWRWIDGRQALTRAIGLDSTDATARQWLGENLLVTGDTPGAVVAFAAARAIDRESPLLAVLHAVALGAAGDAARAVPAVEAAVAADPSLAVVRFIAGTVLIYAREHARAVSELEEARRPCTGDPSRSRHAGTRLREGGAARRGKSNPRVITPKSGGGGRAPFDGEDSPGAGRHRCRPDLAPAGRRGARWILCVGADGVDGLRKHARFAELLARVNSRVGRSQLPPRLPVGPGVAPHNAAGSAFRLKPSVVRRSFRLDLACPAAFRTK